MYIISQSSGASDADYSLHIKEVKKLMDIKSCRWTPHSVSHYRNLFSLICAGISQHISYSVKAYRIFKIIFRYELRPKGISGHKYRFCNMSFCNIDTLRR